MLKQPTFRGGNLTVNSGGVGPDDYLFRLNARGSTWVRVTLDTFNNYWNDLSALAFVLSDLQRTNLIDNKRFYARRKEHIPVMTASEFVASCLVAVRMPQVLEMTIREYFAYRVSEGGLPIATPNSFILEYRGGRVKNVSVGLSCLAYNYPVRGVEVVMESGAVYTVTLQDKVIAICC